jgi:hypothetical protein
MRRARTWDEAQRRLDHMSLLRAIALSAAVWVAILVIALAVTGCKGPDVGRRYCTTPPPGQACGPSPTVHPSP